MMNVYSGDVKIDTVRSREELMVKYNLMDGEVDRALDGETVEGIRVELDDDYLERALISELIRGHGRMNPRDIADLLETTEEGVRKTIERAIGKLRKNVDNLERLQVFRDGATIRRTATIKLTVE